MLWPKAKRVGFVVNAQKPKAALLLGQLTAILRARGIAFFGEKDIAPLLGIPEAAGEADFQSADLCVVIGGDGTMIRAVRLLRSAEVPLLGIHLGSLGFMMETMPEEAAAALTSAVEGDFEVQRRLKLRVQVFGSSGGSASERGDAPQTQTPRVTAFALNEAVVSKGLLSRIIELKTDIDGLFATTFRADGVIVSTPTGSTAYSLSAGGPILAPSLSAFAVTPICPHSLSQRPLVIPGESRICFSLQPGSSEVCLTIDGQQSFPLSPFDRIRIEASPSRALIIRSRHVDFFSALRTRLGWGGGR